MGEHAYNRQLVSGLWDLTPQNLNPAVRAALPGKSFAARYHDVDVVLDFADDLTAPEVATLDTTVSDTAAAFDPLPAVKALGIAQIRENTAYLVSQGALFDDLVYMCTDLERFDILAIYTVGVAGGTPGFFPKTVSTTDGLVETEFADAAAYSLFFTQMVATYAHWKESGQTLRQQILDAGTVAEAEAVAASDDRTWPWDGLP